MTDNELLTLALRHKANGTLPGELAPRDAKRFHEVMRLVNLWEITHTDEEAVLLMAGAATDPERKAFFETAWRVARAGDLIHAKQSAGEWPPLTSHELAAMVSYVAEVPINGVRFTADDVRALRPFVAERDAAGASA